jgi:hypothetical protein
MRQSPAWPWEGRVAIVDQRIMQFTFLCGAEGSRGKGCHYAGDGSDTGPSFTPISRWSFWLWRASAMEVPMPQ